MGEATYRDDQGVIREVAAAALASGEVTRRADGRAQYKAGLGAAAIGDSVAQQTVGIVDLDSAAATLFAVGEPVYWSAATNLAVRAASTLVGATDFYCGRAVRAKINGDAFVRVELNAPWRDGASFPTTISCVTGQPAGPFVLIPASANPNGLLIAHIFGIVTQVFGGAVEDQGIITITDTAGGALTTITVADGGADALTDIRDGWRIYGQAAGAVTLSVPAGLGVQATVTQFTSGAGAAGVLRVHVAGIPIAGLA